MLLKYTRRDDNYRRFFNGCSGVVSYGVPSSVLALFFPGQSETKGGKRKRLITEKPDLDCNILVCVLDTPCLMCCGNRLLHTQILPLIVTVLGKNGARKRLCP